MDDPVPLDDAPISRHQLLAHPAPCSTCPRQCQALLGFLVVEVWGERTAYCWRCWQRYVAKEYGLIVSKHYVLLPPLREMA